MIIDLTESLCDNDTKKLFYTNASCDIVKEIAHMLNTEGMIRKEDFPSSVVSILKARGYVCEKQDIINIKWKEKECSVSQVNCNNKVLVFRLYRIINDEVIKSDLYETTACLSVVDNVVTNIWKDDIFTNDPKGFFNAVKNVLTARGYKCNDCESTHLLYCQIKK